MKILFLDIDGVLNDHVALESKYCGTKPDCVSRLNRVLAAVPDAQIVISSAWRYLMLAGAMTLGGFETLLLTHGVCCKGRVIGHTAADGQIDDEPDRVDVQAWSVAGLRWRREQIYSWARQNNVERFVAVDDLDLEMPEQVKIDGETGLTDADVRSIVMRLALGTEAGT